jgi:hypothetical protein
MAKVAYKRKLSERLLRSLTSRDRTYLVWDEAVRGLVLAVRPNGGRSWKFIYSRHRRSRWFTISSDADALPLADARKRARALRVQVDDNQDPQAQKIAQRMTGTFEELQAAYLQHAKKRNKSWVQADRLVRRFLLPKWSKLRAADITRADVVALIGGIEHSALANTTLAAASAVFSWAIKNEVAGIKANPCANIERHKLASRERILSPSEVPRFWATFGEVGAAGIALKIALLCGARSGEIRHMRGQDIDSGWWNMPGGPQGTWPGTKNAPKPFAVLGSTGARTD